MNSLQPCHFIGGHWVVSEGSEITSSNPAGTEVLWRGNSAGAAEVERAVAAAGAAFPAWRELDLAARKAVVDRYVEILGQRRESLAQALHEETGKPLWESKTEIASMIGKAGISVSAYEQRTGSQEAENNGIRARLVHRPIGVFAVLGPYNFPGHLPNGHIIPALLAGNTVVFKPSELTPRFGELMIQCWEAAALPAGVLNLVQGAAATGELLAKASGIDGLLFTGSSRTGHALHRAFAGHPEKMLALEMGGNNPLVVEQSQDMEAAIYTIIQSAFISAGQRCTCARRLILLRSAANRALLERLASATAAIVVGSGDDAFIGPVISNEAADRVQQFYQSLLEQGAEVVQALARPDAGKPFLQPGIVDVTELAKVDDEECFGPLLQVIWVDDLDAAIDRANATRYGLSAGLISDAPSAWQRFQNRIRAGIVNWNRPITGASGGAPFGGVGASGNFRPGAFYAADYSAYPMASMTADRVSLPDSLAPGITL